MKKLSYLLALSALLFTLSCRQQTMPQTEDEYITAFLENTNASLRSNPDSIFVVLTTLLDENRNRLTARARIDIYNQMGLTRTMVGEFNLVDSLHRNALQIAEMTNDTINKARVMINKGSRHIQSGNPQQAIDYYRQARLMLDNREGMENERGIIYANLGSAFGNISVDSARHYAELGRDLARETGNRQAEGVSVLNIGLLLARHGEYAQAEPVFREALQLFEDIDAKLNSLNTLYFITLLLFETDRADEALPYLKKGTELAQELRLPDMGMMAFYNHRAAIYLENRAFPKALEMLGRAMEIRRADGFPAGIAVSYFNKGEIYIQMRDYNNALRYANRALEIIKENTITLNQRPLIYEIIAYAHAAQGDMEQFSQAIQAGRIYRDSIFTQERFAAIQEVQTRFETEQKQQEIILQRKENQAQRATIFYLTIICALIALLLIALYIFHRRKLQQHVQIIQQHEALANYVRQEHLAPTERTTDTEPDTLSKQRLTALHNLFETEKIYRDAGLNINDVAKRLGSNQAYLSKDINLYHQKNFNEYVNYYRIEEAKEILKAQNEGQHAHLTNEGIAEMVGFGSLTVFYKTFKRMVGVTSLEYKKAVKQMKEV